MGAVRPPSRFRRPFFGFKALGSPKNATEKKDFPRRRELLIKEEKQCSIKSFSQNYLASKFAKWHEYINHAFTELLKLVQIYQFPFICEICCGYQKLESHDQNDESKILSIFLRLFVKNMLKNVRHILANLQTFYLDVIYWTLFIIV